MERFVVIRTKINVEVTGWRRGLCLLLQGLRIKQKENKFTYFSRDSFSKNLMLKSNLLLEGGPGSVARFANAVVVIRF